ncbi:hypothetical protein T439DRAFT_361181 [Meredithblackwellia eburnea MCA 4105]
MVEALNDTPGDPMKAWHVTKSHLIPHLQMLSQKVTFFHKQFQPALLEERKFNSSAIRARLNPLDCGKYSIEVRLRQVQAALTSQLSPRVAEALDDVYTEEELFKALKACASRSSPGPDGLPFEGADPPRAPHPPPSQEGGPHPYD